MLNNTVGYVRPVAHHLNQAHNPDPTPAPNRKGKGLATQCPGGKGRTLRKEIPSDRVGHRRFHVYEVIPESELTAAQIQARNRLRLSGMAGDRSEGGFMPTRPVEL